MFNLLFDWFCNMIDKRLDRKLALRIDKKIAEIDAYYACLIRAEQSTL